MLFIEAPGISRIAACPLLFRALNLKQKFTVWTPNSKNTHLLHL